MKKDSLTLEKKIDKSIELIKKYEKLALKYSDEGFHLAFSGGKDSQVIYELARMAGVKFKAYFYKTTVDPKELLTFIRKNYPEVIWINPRKNMFRIIYEKKAFPTRRARFCCDIIKEKHGLNQVTIIGIRRDESTRRKKRSVFSSDCKLGCDKPLLSPILEWSDEDVFTFLKDRNIDVCKLYFRQNRIGCIGCPMSGNKVKDLINSPVHMRSYILTAQHIIDDFPSSKFAKNFKNGEDAFRWWVSGVSVKEHICMRDKQLKLFEQ